ncbi:flavin reductase [Paracoccus sp. YLB-12]|uniref:Flavin reductase n=1 Tax=Paracoccus maritimus TaxID=2933292 RepID=A0ABT2KB54_9RHOB|nr:flavin reductase [Paracoccus sp. YLB-12]MCT4333139.1 flavin reductase [Paracoccus sp. YLB-12]
MTTSPAATAVTSSQFRDVLGNFPTGVVAVTGIDDAGQPIGMILGSFGSVSLDPPLVSFMPAKSSSSWARLAGCKHYCINILGASQEDICRVLASKSADKFQDVAFTASSCGDPMIIGSLAHIHCRPVTVHDAGDHDIVVCQVDDLSAASPGTPLLFYRGGFGTFTSQSLLSSETALMDKVRLLDRIRDLPESLAQELDTEVSAVALFNEEIVLIGSYGRSRAVDFPSRVGQHLPFMPPIGGVFASWCSPELQAMWLANAGAAGSPERAVATDTIKQIRRRGFAMGLGHEHSLAWEQAAYWKSAGDPKVTSAELRRRIAATLHHYNPASLCDAEEHEFHFAQAPIFDAQSEVQLALTLWGPPGSMPVKNINVWTARLLDATKLATERIGGTAPVADANCAG